MYLLGVRSGQEGKLFLLNVENELRYLCWLNSRKS